MIHGVTEAFRQENVLFLFFLLFVPCDVKLPKSFSVCLCESEAAVSSEPPQKRNFECQTLQFSVWTLCSTVMIHVN